VCVACRWLHGELHVRSMVVVVVTWRGTRGHAYSGKVWAMVGLCS
jgi:hypothetical protein